MFTGIVAATGRVTAIEPLAAGRRLRIACGALLAGAKIGASVSVNGCCLTATEIGASEFGAEAVAETLARTTLGALAPADAVNLELPLRLGESLDGHLVQGHVDGVGEVQGIEHEGGSRRVTIAVPEALRRFVAEKGSIAVDGVSLTVARIVPAGCEIAYIPHTLAVTVAGAYRPGTRVNLEVDVIARYLARLAEFTAGRGAGA